MTGLAVRLAHWLARGRYRAEPSVAERVPSVWFARDDREAAARLLERARGGVAIHGTLRAGHGVDPAFQLFRIWVVEMPTEEDAALLSKYVGDGAPVSARFSIGIACGRLFAIIVGGSTREGTEPYETPETLRALAAELRPLLAEAVTAA